MSRFDLVIFDCDGVLVDSERIAIRIDAIVLADLGWALSEGLGTVLLSDMRALPGLLALPDAGVPSAGPIG